MIAPLIVAVVAFLLFGMASDLHHRRWLQRACSARRAAVLRTAAWACVGLDLPLSMLAEGRVFGPIVWVATLMAGAATTFCLLNFARRRSV